jgi:hypothetical protein
MTTPSPRTRTKVLITLAVLAALVGLIITFSLHHRDKRPTAAPSPTHTMQTGPPPRNPTAPPPATTAKDDPTPENEAQAFITAYTSISYHDPEPTTWVTRTTPHTTEAYAKQLTKTYSGGGGTAWTDMRDKHQHRQATDITITAFPHDPNTYMAEYTQETIQNGEAIATSNQVKILTLTHTTRGWRISAMTELGDQPHQGPVAPTDMGTEIEKHLDNHHHD